MQVHDLDALFPDQAKERRERRRVEPGLVQSPDRYGAVLEHLPDGVIGPQHAGHDAESLLVEAWEHVPVEAPPAVEVAVVADVVDDPQHVDSRHNLGPHDLR